MKSRRGIQIVVLVFVTVIFFVLANGIKGVETVEVGDMAYDFQLEDLDGNIQNLSDYKGQYVVLNFFATWCDPCIVEEPELEKFHVEYGDRYPLLVIDRGEPKKRVVKYKEKYNSTKMYLFDYDNKVSEHFRVVGQPETFIIDPDGVIREKIVGPTTSDELVAKISLMKLNGN